MIRRILVAVDGSGHASKAVDFAGELAGRYGAELVLLHVLPQRGRDIVPPDLADYAQAEGVEVTEAEMIRAVGEELLRRAEDRACAAGATPIESVLDTGDAASRIVDRAGERVDLVVMGSRGLGALSGVLLGSVSHKVAQLAPCATLLVK